MCPQSVYGDESEGGNQFNREKGYLSDEVFELFLDNARKYAKSVTVSFFGEQMLHPKCEYMKRLAYGRKYKLILFSNFSLVTKAMLPAMMDCDVVKISLDASNPETFNYVCPNGDYGVIIVNIGRWLNIDNHPKTYLVFVTSSINKHDKQAFLDKWLPRLSKNDGIITKSVISYGGVMSENACKVAGQNRLTVAWNGDCSPCNLDVNMEMNVGNILETNDVADIVDSRAYKYQLDVIRDKRGICSNRFDANNHRETVVHRGRRAQ
jgi:sulfatase maturation enzyme AslB (radical SAM superfamily)